MRHGEGWGLRDNVPHPSPKGKEVQMYLLELELESFVLDESY